MPVDLARPVSGPAPVVIVTGPAGAGKTTVSRLVAASIGASAHLPIDDFESFIVSGRVDLSRPEAMEQNRSVGGAVFAAALQFAQGGYTAIVDGFIFPEVLGELAGWIGSNGVPLHYAVLRPDLATCLARVRHRRPGDPADLEAFARLHARFGDLDGRDGHLVDHSGRSDEIAHRLLDAHAAGRLLVTAD